MMRIYPPLQAVPIMSTDLTNPLITKLLSFLAAGVAPSIAASATGCDPSYVSQLLENEQFKEELYKRSAKELEKDIQHDSSIEAVEAKALAAIEQKLPFIRTAAEAAKIFSILNSAKKRAIAPANPVDAGGLSTVTFVLPRAALRSIELKMNTQQQVIEVEGRTMAPLPSSQLPAILAARAGAIKAATPVPPTLPNPAALAQIEAHKQRDSSAAARLLAMADHELVIDGVRHVI